MPSYAELLEQTDNQGMNRSYMGTRKTFSAEKFCRRNNLIVPLVGDFAGRRRFEQSAIT